MSKLIVEEVTTPDTNTDLTINPNGTGKTVIDGTLDMNGGELILDADADTSITADTDDQIDFKTGGSDRMHIDASGNVGINDTTPDRRLHVKDSSNRVLLVESTDTNAFTVFKGSGTTDDGKVRFGATGDNAVIYGGGSERVRIDSSGNLNVGRTVATTSNTVGCSVMPVGSIIIERNNDQCMSLNRMNGNGTMILFARGATNNVGSIVGNTSSVSYNTSSDHRLKENVADMTGAITRVKQLAPKRFNFIADPDDTTVDGFLAHEAQTVVPEAVTGTHDEVDDNGDAVMQGIDQSKLVPLLTGALQEAIAKIEALETRVAALEAE